MHLVEYLNPTFSKLFFVADLSLWVILQLFTLNYAKTIEPLREKTNNLCFQLGLTKTRRYSHRSRLEACTFGFKIKRNCTICVAKTKVSASQLLRS